ncbi:MAG: copper resistance protein CopC/CopD, partial [Chloroflexi bacterium]|nr:copper resistance protein CopC/CopD [Chloroflexota bacterium]
MSWSTRRLGSLLVLVALVLAGLGAMAPRADAHANLVRSDPGSDAVLPNAPRQVQLWFSEDPDSAFTEIRVLDSAGQRVDQGGTKAVPGDRLAVVTAVHELAPGSYTVAWKALSAVDGHVTRGAFAFTVGLDQASAGIVLPADEGYSATFPLSVLVRWLNYLGLAGLGAFFLFVPFVLLPALRATPAVAISESDSVGQARRLALASWVVAIVATLLLAVYQANEASGAGLFAAGPLVTLLTGTRFGTLWWTRLALLLVLGALVWQWPRLRTVRENWPHALGFALLASVLATQALGSHSAGAPTATWVAIALDWLHLVGVVAWIGGIVHLLVQLPILARAGSRADSAKVLAATVSRFSRLATISVAVLAATGIYQTWLLVGSLDALLGTDYGWTLLLKLALVAPLVALGGVNQFGWAPRLTRLATTAAKTAAAAGAGLERRFTFTVGAEVGLAVLLLGVVGGLTSIEPARDAILSQGIRRTVTAADLRADVRVQPGIAGLNVFQVRVTENGRPAANVER